MKNFEKEYNKLWNSNNRLFDFQSDKEKQNPIQVENEWSKIESILQKSRLDDYFLKENKENYNNNINDSVSSLNIKSLDWEDSEYSNQIQNSPSKSDSYNNNQDLKPNKLEEMNMNLYLKKFIHPIDNEFDLFIKKKIDDFEKMKTNSNIKENCISNNNSNLKKNRTIKNKIENINNLLGIKKINGEKSLIKEKNNTNFFFGVKFNRRKIEENGNDDDYLGLQKRSYLFEYKNKNRNKNFVLYNINKNKSMIFCKDNKKNLVNEANKVNILLKSNNSNEESGLEKIKNVCFDCIRGQRGELDDSDSNNKDYFKTILYELEWKK